VLDFLAVRKGWPFACNIHSLVEVQSILTTVFINSVVCVFYGTVTIQRDDNFFKNFLLASPRFFRLASYSRTAGHLNHLECALNSYSSSYQNASLSQPLMAQEAISWLLLQYSSRLALAVPWAVRQWLSVNHASTTFQHYCVHRRCCLLLISSTFLDRSVGGIVLSIALPPPKKNSVNHGFTRK